MQFFGKLPTVQRLQATYIIFEDVFNLIGLQVADEMVGMGYRFQCLILLFQLLHLIFCNQCTALL
ncbi:hypothetical protein D9M68_938410 [compost metagenome]